MHDAKNGHTVADQADIDGKLARTRDEFPRAVERIDGPEGDTIARRVLAARGFFFRDDRDIRGQRAQARQDQVFRRMVGIGYRRPRAG